MSEVHSTKICSFPKCGKAAKAKGLCKDHHAQLRKGVPLHELYLRRRPTGSPPRLYFYEIPCPNPSLKGNCHIHRGAPCKDGYHHVFVNGKHLKVHRYVWEKRKGPIPPGMKIDHQCRVRACMNVDHLRVVTQRINAIENSTSPIAINAAATHCIRGHEFTLENTYRHGNNWRKCRSCARIRDAKRRPRKKAEEVLAELLEVPS